MLFSRYFASFTLEGESNDECIYDYLDIFEGNAERGRYTFTKF